MSKVYFAAGLATGFAAFALSPYTVRRVEGESMRPTFNPEENVGSSRFSPDVVLIHKGVRPRVGDVVCANNPKLDGGVLIKRVKSLGGTTVRAKTWPWKRSADGSAGESDIAVPENHVWLSSDAAASGYCDSTYFGPLPQDAVTGVVKAIVWPPNREMRQVWHYLLLSTMMPMCHADSARYGAGSVLPSAKGNELRPKDMTWGKFGGAVHHLAKQITSTYRHSLRLILGEFYVTPAYRKTKRAVRLCYRAGYGAVFVFCVGNTFANVFGFPAGVAGVSMSPTLNDPLANFTSSSIIAESKFGKWFRLNVDWVFVNCWASKSFDVNRGDIVIFTSPKDPPEYVIKRVIALEGDEVETSDGGVVLNPGAIWVEGDNAEKSIDSNNYGPICLGLVVGKASHVIWPPEHWRQLKPDLAPAMKRRAIEKTEDGRFRAVVKVVLCKMTLRGMTLKDSLVFDFSGPVLQNSVCLGDVDNDGASELVVASVAGDLAVYSADKCPDTQPWRYAKLDGQMITCVHVGDLRNEGRNVLVAVTAEGWLHVFDFSKDLSRPIGAAEAEAAAAAAASKSSGAAEGGDGLSLKIDSSPESVKREDAGGEENAEEASAGAAGPGRKKSVTFAAESEKSKKGRKSDSSENSLEAEEIKKKLIHPSFTQRIPANVKEALIFDMNEDGLNEVVLALTDRVVRSYQWQARDDAVDGGDGEEDQGQLVPMNKWEFGLQVGSITRNIDRDGSTAVIVAQPGGALLKLRCKQPTMTSSGEFDKEQSPDEILERAVGALALDYEPLMIGQMRNLNVTCEIQGGLAKSGRRGSTAYAVATLDGALVLVRDERVVWTMQTGQHLFSIRKLDVNGDGSDEIVATSWNGTTYVVTQEKHAVEIVLDSSVIAFTCGQFTVDGLTTPALVYVHRERVVVYYKLELKVGPIETLLETREDPEFQQMLDSLKIRFRSSEEAAEFNDLLLYCSSSR